MLCWNCKKEIPEWAKRCVHCEAEAASVIGPSENSSVLDLLEHLPPEEVEKLRALAHSDLTVEECVNQALVGPCPNCKSPNTGDCDEDPEIEDICIGRCFECGQFWCLECDKLLDKRKPRCTCMDGDED